MYVYRIHLKAGSDLLPKSSRVAPTLDTISCQQWLHRELLRGRRGWHLSARARWGPPPIRSCGRVYLSLAQLIYSWQHCINVWLRRVEIYDPYQRMPPLHFAPALSLWHTLRTLCANTYVVLTKKASKSTENRKWSQWLFVGLKPVLIFLNIKLLVNALMYYALI